MVRLMRCSDLFITCLLVCAVVIVGNVNAREGEVDDESHFTYDMNAKTGPHNWVNLNPKWKECGKGEHQSPIDLADDRAEAVSSIGKLKRTYKPAPAIVKNRGHDVMVEWQGDAGGVVINGTEYNLQQCHWHTPSEHTLNGKRFKMEIHLVHNNSQGGTAVIGITYKLGRPDTFLEKLLPHVKTADHKGKSVGVIDPWDIKFGSRKYYKYMGSLTTPPCSEGIVWTVLKKVRTVSREQIRGLKAVVHDENKENARPLQSSKKRDVCIYIPKAPK